VLPVVLVTAERVAAVLAERDVIQANLLELDGSYVKRLLDGAALTGQTRPRWATAAATFAGLWETYLAYSAVVDRIAELASGDRRALKKDLPELNQLLTGACVTLPGAPAPLGRRDLAGAGRPALTIAAVVLAMRRSFAEVTEVTAAVEAVLAGLGPPLDAAAEKLTGARRLVPGLGDDIETAFREAELALDALLVASNADPLALFSPGGATPRTPRGMSDGEARISDMQTSPGGADFSPGGHPPPIPPGPRERSGGQVDTSAADRLLEQVAALCLRIAELDRLRGQARHRIDALAAAVRSARTDRQDALTAWQNAAARVTPLPPLPVDIAEPPLASLGALAAGGQWSRLGAELDRCEAELAASIAQTSDVREMASAAVGRRDELRGLLGAYKAKAARLGAAEDTELAARYDQAYDQLWTAPCDLAAAESAVVAYQRAILATEGRR
jgi:hypothetical protein